MSRLAQTIRRVAEEYSAAHGLSLEQTIHDAMLGCLACLVVLIDVTLLAAAAGGGQ